MITGIAAAADALYVEARDGNVKRLFKRAHGTADAPLTEVALPVAGSFALNDDEGGHGAADPRLPGLVLDLQGWTRARQIVQVEASGRVSNTGLQPRGPYDAPDDIVATEVLVKSHDGAMVPMSIIHKRGIELDGNNPTLLYGYAQLRHHRGAVLQRHAHGLARSGGVFAVANPRGSGVYGEDWYAPASRPPSPTPGRTSSPAPNG